MQYQSLATNQLGLDAWGRPKVVNDFSMFTALWTLSVPNRVWLQYNDTGTGFAEQAAVDNVLVKSTHGHLLVTGNSVTDVAIVSKRHPRYQPNRGLLYSSALFVPNPEYVGTRQFGLISTENGVFFEVIGDGTEYVLNIVRRTTALGVTTDTRVDITNRLPAGFDISKGHVYDVQMEWRGVGNFYIFIDLGLTYTFALLGTLDELSISNPALHVGFRCIGAAAGYDLTLAAGCVDVTSEGGHRSNKLYTSVNTGTTLLTTTNTGVGILAVRLPETITYDGHTIRYTRDMILTELSTFCKDEAFRSVYVARLLHTPNLLALAGWSTANDSFYEYITNSTGTLDTAFQLDKAAMHLIYATRNEKDFASSHTNPDPRTSDYYLTGGDILVVELLSDGNSTGGATLEFAEEV